MGGKLKFNTIENISTNTSNWYLILYDEETNNFKDVEHNNAQETILNEFE